MQKVHHSKFLSKFKRDPVIIEHGIRGLLCPELRPDPHPDVRFAIKEIALRYGGEVRNLYVNLPIRGGKLNTVSRINDLREGVNRADDGIWQAFPFHFRMAIRTVGPGWDPETLLLAVFIRTAGGP